MTVSYDGLYNGGEPGTPSLPIDYLRFSVPYNATNFTVTTTVGNMLMYPSSHLVYPCQIPRMICDTTPVIITLPDTAAYFSGSIYPSVRAWVADEGFLAGENHIVTVAVMPIAFKHVNYGLMPNSVRQSLSVTLNISYDISNVLDIYPFANCDESLRDEGYELTRSIVVNPQSVQSFAPTEMGMSSMFIPYQTTGIQDENIFPYLVITTNELSHAMRRFVALKKQKGYNVKIATLSEVLSDPYACIGDIVPVNGYPTVTFTDDAGKIREYLKIANWYNKTKYLLFAGTDVPFRITHEMTPIDSYDIPNDLYYADLNSNWHGGNSNIDRHPELFVGRILAKNEDQINNFTDKLFRYELNPGKGDFSYLRRSLYTEGKDMDGESKLIGKRMNNLCPDSMLISEKWTNPTPKACDVIDAINSNQFGFWGTFNHGEPTCISISGGGAHRLYRLWAIDSCEVSQSTHHDYEANNGLDNIMNKDFPMVSYSISCETMPYDTLPGFESIPMNFGESFTTGKDYGGPAYLGNTRDGFIRWSAKLGEYFAENLNNGMFKIGVAEALSKTNSVHPYVDLYLSLVHNLLGDPTMEMWSDIPQKYSNIEVIRSDNSITISGINVDSTIIAYSSNDLQIGSDTVSSSVVTLTSVSPNSTVMLYKHNYIPYIAPLVLQNATFSNSQYIIATDIMAGNCVDNNRTPGDVVVSDGVEYEAEITGKAILCDGFKVEKGATFAIYPSSF